MISDLASPTFASSENSFTLSMTAFAACVAALHAERQHPAVAALEVALGVLVLRV